MWFLLVRRVASATAMPGGGDVLADGRAVCGGGRGKKAVAMVIDREDERRHTRVGGKEAIRKVHDRSGSKNLRELHCYL